MCVNVSQRVCMCITCMSSAHGDQKRASVLWDWSYKWVMSHHVCAGNWTQVLCKYKWSKPESLLSSLMFVFIDLIKTHLASSMSLKILSYFFVNISLYFKAYVDCVAATKVWFLRRGKGC